MPIRLAAIVPHPIILIPSIGKENLFQLEKTQNFYQKIGEEIRQNKIKSIFIISSHGKAENDFFSLDAAKEFSINFEEFGDFSSNSSVGGDLDLTQNIREEMETIVGIKTNYKKVLDFGCGVPLFRLCLDKDTEVSPFHTSGKTITEHFFVGEKIGQILKKEKRKIAIIASGDLSPRLTKNSPAGYSPKGAKFDQRLIELLQNKKIEEIINFDEATISEAGPCGLKPIAVLLGILSSAEIGWNMENFVYEAPFGVGYLTTLLKTEEKT